jgi:putative Mn2+ efflux pump MntP
MDTFAVGICIGLGREKFCIKTALIIGLYFGVFQAVMPLIGFCIGEIFAEKVSNYGSWIAFILLFGLGSKMIYEGLKKQIENISQFSLSPKIMLPLAIATSIDALSVGVSFAMVDIKLFFAVTLIGAVTLIISMLGVRLGGICGTKYRTKALCMGGMILILIGFNILRGV